MGVKSLFVEKRSPKGTISTSKQIQRAWLAAKAGCVLPRNCIYCSLHLLYGLLRTVHSHVRQHHLHETSGLCSEQCLLLAFSHPHFGWNQWRFHQPHWAPDRVRHNHLSAETVCFFTLTFLQPLPNPFQQQSSNDQKSFYYQYLIHPFSDHFQSEKVRWARSPLTVRNLFFF